MRVVRNKHKRVGTDGVKTHVMELSRSYRRGGKLAAAGRGAMTAGRGAAVVGRIGGKGAMIGGRILGAGLKVAGRVAVRGLAAAGRTESGKAAGVALHKAGGVVGSKARKVSNVAINATNHARMKVSGAAHAIGRAGHAIDHKIASGINSLTSRKSKPVVIKPVAPAHVHPTPAHAPSVIHLGPPKPVKNGMPGKPPVVKAPHPPSSSKPVGRDWRTLPRSGAHDHLQTQPPLKRKRK